MKAKWRPTSRSITRCSGAIIRSRRLSGAANILVMPGLQSASISAKLLRAVGGESVMGPYILGLEHPVQIAPMTASASDLVMLAVLAAGDAHARQQRRRRGARSAPRLEPAPLREARR